MHHAMIDLETMGLTPGSQVLSIGAVIFRPGELFLGREFYRNVSRESQEWLTYNVSTAEWWHRQSKEARDALRVDAVPIRDAATAFHEWLLDCDVDYVWSHGAGFDVVLWESACRVMRLMPPPWKFQNVRDTRTLYHLAGVSKLDVPFEGSQHNALHDARHQARLALLAFQKLGVKIDD